MWTIEAPACQASMADWAISSGVIGMWGAMSRIMRLPVMAAVMMTFSMDYPRTFFSVSVIASSRIWTIRSIWASVMM